jgi:hypothetical protein
MRQSRLPGALVSISASLAVVIAATMVRGGPAQAQTTDRPVLFRLGGTGIDYTKDVTVAPDGTIVAAGYFAGTVDFDPGPGITNLRASGVVDNFLAQYGPAGDLRWAFGSGGAGADIPHTVRLGPAGNVYVAGYFSGTADFDPGSGTANRTSAGERDVYVASYDSAGRYRWAATLGGPGTDEGFDLAVSADGAVVATGIFTGTVNLAGGTGSRRVTSAGGEDAFLVAYDPQGAFRWGLTVGGPGADHGHAVRFGPDGQVYLAGFFSGRADFDPNSPAGTATATGGWDAFLARYDGAGRFDWVRPIGGRGNDQVRPGGMEVHDGQVYLTGDFAGMTDFDPGPGAADLTSRGLGDIFIAAYSGAGDYRWAIGMGGPMLDAGHRLVVDEMGDIYVTGWFQGKVDFDPGNAIHDVTSQGMGGASDIFVARYDGNGRFAWANGFGAPVSGADNNSLGGGLGRDAHGGLVVGGRFFGSVDFDPGPSSATLASAGASDAWLVKYDTVGQLWRGAPPAPDTPTSPPPTTTDGPPTVTASPPAPSPTTAPPTVTVAPTVPTTALPTRAPEPTRVLLPMLLRGERLGDSARR